MKRSMLRIVCCLCWCMAIAVAVQAQRFSFFNLNIGSGLPQSQAYCLEQDKFGNLWVGTLGGIARYDGEQFVQYTVRDGLLSNSVSDIEFDRKGRLVISSGGGLQLFDGKTFSTLVKNNNESRLYASHISIDEHNRLFYLSNGFICETGYTAKGSSRQLSDKNTGYTALYYCKQKKQLLAASTTGNVYLYDIGTTLTPTDSFVATDKRTLVLKAFEDSKGKIWLLCNTGLCTLSGQYIVPHSLPGKGPTVTAATTSATEDRNGKLWLGSISGAYCVDDSTVTFFNQHNGLSNNIIYAVLTDKEGNVWFASDGQGIFRFSGGPFVSIDESFGLPDKQVTGIAGDDEGNIYFASYSGKLARYKPDGSVEVIHSKELDNTMIVGLLMQNGHDLWIETRMKGLYHYSKGVIKPVPITVSPFQYAVASLYSDSKNRLWVGLLRDVVYLENGQFNLVRMPAAGTIFDFAETGNDSMIIATATGLVTYSNGMATKWKTGKIIDSVAAQCLLVKDHKLYIGTSDFGVIVYDLATKAVRLYNRSNGLSSDFVYTLITDEYDNLWVGTGLGICKIYTNKNGETRIERYGQPQGVAGLESNHKAVYRSPDGRIWFGTTEGVVCYMPQGQLTRSRPVSIVLKSVKLFGRNYIDSNYYQSLSPWYHIPEQLRLPYRANSLTFAFQAITLSPSDKILYRYRLAGTDAPWSSWSTDNSVTFSSLEPGNYTLQIECDNGGNKTASQSLQYTFTIATPFHKSKWFMLSILGACVLLGIGMQYAANKRKQNRLKREEAMRREEQNRVRERTAEDFHDEVGNKLTRINILTNVLKTKLPVSNPDTERIINQIQENTQQLYSGTRDILWSLQPANDNLFEIVNRLRDLAGELFSDTDTEFSLIGNDPAFKEHRMPMDKSRNFIMLFKEALNNCLKYANATHVLLLIRKPAADMVTVELQDDGTGFDSSTVKTGNGLKNLRSRAQRLGGSIEIVSAPGMGTCIRLHMPV